MDAPNSSTDVDVPSASGRSKSPGVVAALADLVTLPPVVFRVVVVALQCATIAITWPLWQTRANPPLLPLFSALSGINFGPWMVVSALAVLVRPGWGLLVHTAVAALAMMADQTRMQPEIVSGCLLLLGTLASPAAKWIARAHLVTLWFYSGWHKWWSVGFFTYTAHWLWTSLLPSASPEWSWYFGATIAVTEMLLGLLTLVAVLRPFVAIVGFAFHLGVVGSLVALQWNEAVWPWNGMLAFAGPALVASWREPLFATWRLQPRWARAAATAMVLFPLGYYLNVVDAYFAHCLYSSNVPRGYLHRPGVSIDLVLEPLSTLRVPLPPCPRLFEAYFEAVSEPGDCLEIHDPRPLSRWCGLEHSERYHPGTLELESPSH